MQLTISERLDQLAAVLTATGPAAGGRRVALALEPAVRDDLPAVDGVTVHPLSALFRESEMVEVREQAFRLMRRFAGHPDWTVWRGIPVGQFILHSYRFFVDAVFQAELLERILVRDALGERVEELVWAVDDPGFTRLLETFVSERGITARVRLPAASWVTSLRTSRAAELWTQMTRGGGPAAVWRRVTERLFPERGESGPAGGAGVAGARADGTGRSQPEPGPGLVCFALEYENHFRSFRPVAAELDRRGRNWSLLAYRKVFKEALSGMGVPFVDGEAPDPEACEAADSEARIARKALAKRWKGLREDPELIAAFRYRGLGLAPFVERSLRAFFEYQFVLGVRGFETTRRALERLEPSLLVVMDDMSFYGRAAVEAARRLGVPTLNIQHGAIGDINHYRVVSADRLAVWGQYSAEKLMEAGVEKRKLAITGQPRFDRLIGRPHGDPGPGPGAGGEAMPSGPARRDPARREPGRREAVRRELGIPGDARVILWAPNPLSRFPRYRSLNRRHLERLLAAAAGIERAALLIKLHPVEDAPGFERTVAGAGAGLPVALVRHGEIPPLLDAADVLVARGTTVIIEAMLAGLPVIVLNLHGFHEFIPCETFGAGIVVRDPAALAPALEAVLGADPGTREALRRGSEALLEAYTGGRDGKAASRVADLIEEMAGAQGPSGGNRCR